MHTGHGIEIVHETRLTREKVSLSPARVAGPRAGRGGAVVSRESLV